MCDFAYRGGPGSQQQKQKASAQRRPFGMRQVLGTFFWGRGNNGFRTRRGEDILKLQVGFLHLWPPLPPGPPRADAARRVPERRPLRFLYICCWSLNCAPSRA